MCMLVTVSISACGKSEEKITEVPKTELQKWNDARANEITGGEPAEVVMNHYTQDLNLAEIELYDFLEKYYNDEVTLDKNNVAENIESLSKDFFELSRRSALLGYSLDYKFTPYKNEVRLYVLMYSNGSYISNLRYSDNISIKYSQNNQ